MASRFHILIVEDEPLVVEVLQATLDTEYRVSSVNTVGEALAFLRTGARRCGSIGQCSCPMAEELKLPASLTSLAQRSSRCRVIPRS